MISQVIINLLTAIWAKKKYPNYFPEGELSNEEKRDINKRIRDLLTSKIGGVILLSADSIVISAFLGLEILAIYQNYFYVITALTGIFDIIFTSIISGIGNSLVVESNEKNYNDLKKLLSTVY